MISKVVPLGKIVVFAVKHAVHGASLTLLGNVFESTFKVL